MAKKIDAPLYFATPAEFGAWLKQRGESVDELLVGFYKRGSGQPGMTWPESVDEALCAGWIDGVRRRVDDERYTIRFTPRRARSIWSAVNIARFAELTRLGRMGPAGKAAYARREESRSNVYAYEQPEAATLDASARALFAATPGALEFFESQAPWYRRVATHWVTSAKRPETRAKRLGILIEDSAVGRRIKQLQQAPKASANLPA